MEQEDKIQLPKTYVGAIENKTEVPMTESTESIGEMIMEFRGQQVMIDRDLARLYGVTTKVLNQAVKKFFVVWTMVMLHPPRASSSTAKCLMHTGLSAT